MVKFQLRYCPALAKKPKDNVPVTDDKPRKKPDPFDNPSQELLIDQIPKQHSSHNLVLNKYPVIPNHFILATKANRPQTDLLEESDLWITHACLKAWRESSSGHGAGRLFAFFNSGEHSGASQVHRHLQFLPEIDMRIGGDAENKPDWKLLIDSMDTRAHPSVPLLHDPGLPFVHFATPLEAEITPRKLHLRYTMLMTAALSAIKHADETADSIAYDESVQIEHNGQTTFSYNLAMTTDRLAICPRKAEAASVPGVGGDSSVAINGTILAGTLMVKDKREWEALTDNPHAIDEILQTIAYPRHDVSGTKL